MLNNEGKENIEAIRVAIEKIWGGKCQIVEIKVNNAPFCMFDMKIKINNRFEVLLSYDRSIMGIYIKKSGEYINIRKLTDQEIIGGFNSCSPLSLIHNFTILNEMLNSMV